MGIHRFSSESVCDGHPDKIADAIADTVLDAQLDQDRHSRVACEVMCKGGQVVLAGEIRSRAEIDVDAVVRRTIRDIGYCDPAEAFSADRVEILDLLERQSESLENDDCTPGASDQGMIFGYATDETPELMPLPILVAQRLAEGLSDARRAGVLPWARPDGKTQVTVTYSDNQPVHVDTVVVAIQHTPDARRSEIEGFVREELLPERLGPWFTPDIRVLVNQAGDFVRGGPDADCGLTGRKIIADTYGGMARHGGGAFSGKDPWKVDRGAAYLARAAARHLVKNGLAHRAEIQVAFAIGLAKPVAISVDTFGTGDSVAAQRYLAGWDFRPAAIVRRMDLLRPIYRQTACFGHFGRTGFPWEDL